MCSTAGRCIVARRLRPSQQSTAAAWLRPIGSAKHIAPWSFGKLRFRRTAPNVPVIGQPAGPGRSTLAASGLSYTTEATHLRAEVTGQPQPSSLKCRSETADHAGAPRGGPSSKLGASCQAANHSFDAGRRRATAVHEAEGYVSAPQ